MRASRVGGGVRACENEARLVVPSTFRKASFSPPPLDHTCSLSLSLSHLSVTWHSADFSRSHCARTVCLGGKREPECATRELECLFRFCLEQELQIQDPRFRTRTGACYQGSRGVRAHGGFLLAHPAVITGPRAAGQKRWCGLEPRSRHGPGTSEVERTRENTQKNERLGLRPTSTPEVRIIANDYSIIIRMRAPTPPQDFNNWNARI